jgi:hypothetical protein
VCGRYEICLAHYRDQWLALTNKEVNLRVPQKAKNLMICALRTICGLGTSSNKLRTKYFCYFIIQTTSLFIKIVFSNTKLQSNCTRQIVECVAGLMTKQRGKADLRLWTAYYKELCSDLLRFIVLNVRRTVPSVMIQRRSLSNWDYKFSVHCHEEHQSLYIILDYKNIMQLVNLIAE